MSRIRLSAILFSFFFLCLNITAQVLPFSVRDTTLDWLMKKKVEVAVFCTLSDEMIRN